MYGFLVVIHVLASLFLIAVILLQAGRGGGLSESLGSNQMQNVFGTKSATVLAKVTGVCAAIFIIASLSLAILSSHRARSIVDKIPAQRPPVKSRTVEEVPIDTKEAKTMTEDINKDLEKTAEGVKAAAKQVKEETSAEPVKEGGTTE